MSLEKWFVIIQFWFLIFLREQLKIDFWIWNHVLFWEWSMFQWIRERSGKTTTSSLRENGNKIKFLIERNKLASEKWTRFWLLWIFVWFYTFFVLLHFIKKKKITPFHIFFLIRSRLFRISRKKLDKHSLVPTTYQMYNVSYFCYGITL